MDNPLEIVQQEGFYGVKPKMSSVAVVVYSLDEKNLLDKVGVVTEKNALFPGGIYQGLVMGTLEKNDSSLLSRAKKEVLQEAGLNIIESGRWKYLGEMYSSKLVLEPVYCYSVDATGISLSEPQGDGFPQEKGISFEMIPLSRTSEIADSLFQACFFRLFSNLYKGDILS